MTDDQARQSARLMTRGQNGDADAYTELLTLLASVTRKYARRRVGDVPWVDDVVQETLMSVHGARHTFDGRRPFAPWFYAIVSSRLIDVIRRERRIASREVAVEPLAEPAAGGEASGVHVRPALDPDEVRAAMATLTPKQRRVVHALKFRHETVREAGKRLGMSESAIKVTAHRGYQALRKALGMTRREH